MISTIEFSVTQIVNPGTDDSSERQLIFGDSSKLVIRRYGQRALVSPIESGSDEYTVQIARGGGDWQTFISGLEKTAPDGSTYTYKVEEICIRDLLGNVVTGYETTYNLPENGGQLIEEGGQYVGIRNINDGATASLVNKKIVEAELNLKKVVKAGTDNPLNGDLTKTNGSYTFTVTGPYGSDSPITKYIRIIALSNDRGENIEPRYTTRYTYQIGDTEEGRDAMTPAVVGDGGVPIDNLIPGQYTITEGGWTFDTIPVGSMMVLENIDVSSGANNETDVSRKEAVVYIGEGEIGSLEVSFTNCLKPYPGIQIEKIDEKYDSTTGLHTITRYKEAFTGNDDDRTVVSESDNLMSVTFVQATDAANPATLTIGNEPGAELPHTGGEGTMIFYALGAVLALFACGGITINKMRKAA